MVSPLAKSVARDFLNATVAGGLLGSNRLGTNEADLYGLAMEIHNDIGLQSEINSALREQISQQKWLIDNLGDNARAVYGNANSTYSLVLAIAQDEMWIDADIEKFKSLRDSGRDEHVGSMWSHTVSGFASSMDMSDHGDKAMLAGIAGVSIVFPIVGLGVLIYCGVEGTILIGDGAIDMLSDDDGTNKEGARSFGEGAGIIVSVILLYGIARGAGRLKAKFFKPDAREADTKSSSPPRGIVGRVRQVNRFASRVLFDTATQRGKPRGTGGGARTGVDISRVAPREVVDQLRGPRINLLPPLPRLPLKARFVQNLADLLGVKIKIGDTRTGGVTASRDASVGDTAIEAPIPLDRPARGSRGARDTNPDPVPRDFQDGINTRDLGTPPEEGTAFARSPIEPLEPDTVDIPGPPPLPSSRAVGPTTGPRTSGGYNPVTSSMIEASHEVGRSTPAAPRRPLSEPAMGGGEDTLTCGGGEPITEELTPIDLLGENPINLLADPGATQPVLPTPPKPLPPASEYLSESTAFGNYAEVFRGLDSAPPQPPIGSDFVAPDPQGTVAMRMRERPRGTPPANAEAARGRETLAECLTILKRDTTFTRFVQGADNIAKYSLQQNGSFPNNISDKYRPMDYYKLTKALAAVTYYAQKYTSSWPLELLHYAAWEISENDPAMSMKAFGELIVIAKDILSKNPNLFTFREPSSPAR